MKFSFVFPGQGSQSLGMGQWLVNEFSIARETFEEASSALNLDIQKLCFNSSDAELALTVNTQPALLCVSTATQRVLQQKLNLAVSFTAGHSIGEYASMVLSGVLPFATAMKAVRLRGESMQAAVPVGQGGMLATLGLNEEQAQVLCSWAEKESGEGPAQVANYNCPGQIVLSGNLKALNFIKDNFKPEVIPGEAKRVKFIPLNVSAPFHCSLMKPAEKAMETFFAPVTFSTPKIPIVQNLTAHVETNPENLKKNLVAQVSGSVRWTQSVQTLTNLGVDQYLECGHGQVLKGLIKKIDDKATVHSLQSLEDLQKIEAFINSGGAQ